MPTLPAYLLQVNGALLLFCALYYLGLRRLTFFRLNRAVLLAGLLLAPLYPLIDWAAWLAPAAPLRAGLRELAPQWQLIRPAVAAPTGPTLADWLLGAYWAGVAMLTGRLLVQLLSVYRLHRGSRPEVVAGVPVRVLAAEVAPFAFWRTVYLNPRLHPAAELPAVLCHEQVHVREWHTLDVLLAQLSLIWFWFNPGMWLLRRALHENLEFSTDYEVLRSGQLDAKSYQYSLLHHSLGGPPNALVSSFNLHLLKTRIAMMNQPQSRPRQAARYLLLLPLAALLALGSCDRQIEQIKTIDPAAAVRASKYILNGQPSTEAEINSLNTADIERMEVINDKQLLRQFGEPAPTFVSVVVTKAQGKSAAVDAFDRQYKLGVYSPDFGKQAKFSDMATGDMSQALVFVDGQPASKAELDKVDPETISYMMVCKGYKAPKEFGEAGKNGVIVLVTRPNAQSEAVRAFEQRYHIDQTLQGPKVGDDAVPVNPTSALLPAFMKNDRC